MSIYLINRLYVSDWAKYANIYHIASQSQLYNNLSIMTECLKSQGMSKCWLLWNNELVIENMNLLEHKSISHIALNFSPSWVRYGVPFTNDLDFYNSILFHHLFHHFNFSATVPTSFRQHKLQLPMRQIKFHMWRYSKAIQMTNDNDPSKVYQAKLNIHGNAMLWEAFP